MLQHCVYKVLCRSMFVHVNQIDIYVAHNMNIFLFCLKFPQQVRNNFIELSNISVGRPVNNSYQDVFFQTKLIFIKFTEDRFNIFFIETKIFDTRTFNVVFNKQRHSPSTSILSTRVFRFVALYTNRVFIFLFQPTFTIAN